MFGKYIEADKEIYSFKGVLRNPENNLITANILYIQIFECQVFLKQSVSMNNVQGPGKNNRRIKRENL